MSTALTDPDPSRPVHCPYCRGMLRWTVARWPATGVFECERCGEFPDFRQVPRAPAPLSAYSEGE